MSIYLHLFHGRKSPDEQLDDWGSEGPVIGPLQYVHVTYLCSIRVGIRRSLVEQFFPEEDARMKSFVAGTPAGYTSCYTDPDAIEDVWLKIHEDMILHDGVYYGDWSIGGSAIEAVDFSAGRVVS